MLLLRGTRHEQHSARGTQALKAGRLNKSQGPLQGHPRHRGEQMRRKRDLVSTHFLPSSGWRVHPFPWTSAPEGCCGDSSQASCGLRQAKKGKAAAAAAVSLSFPPPSPASPFLLHKQSCARQEKSRLLPPILKARKNSLDPLSSSSRDASLLASLYWT